MTPAHDLEPLGHGLFIWHAYDPVAKTDLFSTAMVTPGGLVLVDPIPLDDEALADLRRLGAVFGIVVTNENHPRAAADYAALFNAPIFGRQASKIFDGISTVLDGDLIADELKVITIDGAAPGEIALYHSANGGTVLVGGILNLNWCVRPGFSDSFIWVAGAGRRWAAGRSGALRPRS